VDEQDDPTIKEKYAARFREICRYAKAQDPYSCSAMRAAKREVEELEDELVQMKLQADRNFQEKKARQKMDEDSAAIEENSLPISTKPTYFEEYGSKLKSARLQFRNCTSMDFRNIFYRMVHINNTMTGKALLGIISLGISLFSANEDCSDPIRYEKDRSYYAFQEFKISELKSYDSYTVKEPVQFFPYELGIVYHYHYVEVDYPSKRKKTKKNWQVRLYNSDIDGLITVTFYDTWVNMTSPSGNSYTKFPKN